jgi:predicted Zn-dependent protease
MLVQSAWTDTMVKSILYKYLLKAILFALIALVLYGVFPGTGLAIILMLFVGLRFTSLVAEALRKPVSAEQWETKLGALTSRYEKLPPEKRAALAAVLKLDPRLSAHELAHAQVNNAIHSYVPPRSKRELGAEALGVVAFAILIPLNIALYTRDFFSFRTPQSWEGAVVAVLCVGLYAWPHRWWKSPECSELRILWWALPFVLALLLLNRAIETRHPYLNPFDPDHNRLAAERVLALKNNVVAGRHADWVLRYARQLDERGETQQAARLYREALRLDANNRTAYARLAALEAQSSGGTAENPAQPAVASSAPYWTADKPVTQSPRVRIDSGLENVEGCTVVIVAVGEVSDELLDAVGHVIRNELDLPVCISTNTVALPPHTRVRGLVTGRQWTDDSIFQAFTNTTKLFPKAPIKYVLITPVDIYHDGVNYVFSGTAEWGAVVSSARFGEPKGNGSLLRQRTAKQTLCALIKSFKVPISTDRNCVTSYTHNLDEFDAKGNRPNAETIKLFRQAVAGLNSGWHNYQATHRASK